MSRGPKAVALDLSRQEQGEIQRLLRRHGTGQALVSRLRIILACAEPGATNLGVATALGVSRQTVALWRGRFAAHRLPGLVDAPRSGAPRSIDDEAVERLVALTLEEAPANATHWSTRAMARRTGMSQSAVSRIWRAFGLRPHQADTFKLSADPAFVEKVRDVVGLYLAPPDRALVLCVDEKPQIQAVQGTAAAFPLRPGQAERVTHDYRRHGTLDLFAALDVKAGTVIGSCKPRHRSVEFRAFLEQVESSVARDLEVHLVLDNLKTHKTTLVHDWLVQHPRFHLHFTPTSASWLNLVECWFSVLSRRRLERGAFSSTEGLEAAIRDYIAETNAHPRPFVWTKSADAILASVSRFCTQISNSDHEEWLTINEAGRAIATSPYATPALKDLWLEIRRSYEETGVGWAAGREWRGAMAKGTEVAAFRLHRSEMDALAAAIGRGRDRLMTDEWLNAKKVAALLNQNPDRGRFREVWDVLLERLGAGKPAVQDGVALRMEGRLLAGKSVPCLHVDDVDALGRITGGRRSAGPKGDEWLGMADAAALFGKHQSDPTFRRSWQDLVAAACQGPVLDGARPVRIEFRTATKAVWCLHRDEAEWFAKRTWPRRHGPARKPYVPLAGLRHDEAVDGMRDAFDLLAEEVDGLIADASPVSLLGREGLRFERLPEGGLAVHPDDVAGFLEAVGELSGPAHAP